MLAAVLAVGVWREANRPEPSRGPALDTRAPDDAKVEFRFLDEPAAEVTVPEPPAVEPAPAPSPDPRPPLAEAVRPPTVPQIPRTLPPELLALIRKPPTLPAVVEVPVTVTPQQRDDAAPPGPLRPVADTRPGTGSSPVPPIHGALSPGQSIVYVLDASGSMGEWGKFEAARRALVATLRGQPEGVRFQVVVYSGSPRRLLSGAGCVAVTAETVARAEAAVQAISPAGRSEHAGGLWVAADLRPDLVLVMTDVDDLPGAMLRGVLARAQKPVRVFVATVTAEGVGPPRELK
jgi:hypothetical protein